MQRAFATWQLKQACCFGKGAEREKTRRRLTGRLILRETIGAAYAGAKVAAALV